MADYYPLIARAIEGLAQQSPEARRAVYERARRALTTQLRSLNPPLSEAEIQHESVALDHAIDRIEAKYAAGPVGLDLEAFSHMLSDGTGQGGEPARSLAPAPGAAHGLRAPAPQPSATDEVAAYAEPDSARPKIDSRPHPAMQDKSRGRNILFGAILALVILGIAGFAWWQRNAAQQVQPEPVAEAAQPVPQEAAKINERVGVQQAPPPAPAPAQDAGQAAIATAHRAVFYEEDPAHPQTPKAQVGRVVWRLEDVNPGQGQALEKAVTASIDIPDAGLTVRMVLRRNLDTTLPASHTVELTFTTRPGETGRVIRDVGLLQFKNEEAERGTPVAGLPVPVGENLFLIGLSNLQGDVERNTQYFVRRNWIDLPVRMASGQRAILSFEKGPSGEQVLTAAFSQWQ